VGGNQQDIVEGERFLHYTHGLGPSQKPHYTHPAVNGNRPHALID
jgi:hypothetical protein